MLNTLLTGLRGQAAMQAEIIALRHQLTVMQRTQKPKKLLLNRGDDACGFGCYECGRAGVPL